KHDKRELMAQTWYPIENTNNKNKKSLYPKDKKMFNEYKQALSKALRVPVFTFDYWKYIKTNSYDNVAISNSEDKYPLVIISHGYGTMKELHVSQAENLASHGYIVLALDHTYCTIVTTFPNGLVTNTKLDMYSDEKFLDNKEYLGDIWTKDINFILKQIIKLDSGFIKSNVTDRIDTDNIGIMGHSFGAGTSLNATYKEKNIKAGICMDGGIYNEDNINELDKPIMFMTTTDSLWFEENLKNRKQDNISKSLGNRLAKYYEMQYEIINNAKENSGYLLSIEGTRHHNFTDIQIYSKIFSVIGFTGKINGRRSNDIVNTYTLEFFNKYLKGKESILLGRYNDRYPEVEFYK
ncbi:MAG: hypothetical protein ABF289_08130, partial [Clostridiales bacterium]